MDICNLNWTSLQSSIFSLLCRRSGDKLSQREIAISLNVSPTAVGNALKLLLKQNLIIVEKSKIINYVLFNRNNPVAIGLKRAENLRCVYLSGLFSFLERELPGGTVVIFGSYSLGEDRAVSDVDIAIVGRRSKIIDFTKYEKSLGRIIHVQFFNLWSDIPVHLRNNILNGMVIHGGVEL